MTSADASPTEKTWPYEMTISLNVLNHLGIGLYSNVPAVLSEVVANAWDADAKVVDIRINKDLGEICIFDDGNGMNLEDVNDRYLMVGYRKRDEITGLTPGLRHPMGRKGIGKLAVFSIADTVEIYSAKGSQRHAFRMNSERIQEQIKNSKTETYHPLPLKEDSVDFDRGTKILLKDLKKGFRRTEEFSRRRLARRFSVIGPKNEFEVKINGEPITTKDRGYYDKIEFLWHMGGRGNLDEGFFEDSDESKLKGNVKEAFELETDGLLDADWTVTGWIGTVDE